LYPTKETLKDIRFVVRDGQPPVLVVKIPDDLPAGVYTGPIVDAETREPKGFIRIECESKTTNGRDAGWDEPVGLATPRGTTALVN
jgi:hypothetical protein